MSRLQMKTHKELKKNLDQAIVSELKGKAESLKIGVIKGSNFYAFKYGVDYKFYDLASLTKVIFTVCAFMHYEDQVGAIIHKKVIEILPWFKASSQVQVKDLLAHQSGAPALYPAFKELEFPTFEGLAPLNLLVRDIPFDQKEVVYSDVGFFVLGAILEEIYNKPLFQIFEDLRDVFEMGQLHFNPLNGQKGQRGQKPKFKKSIYAPTEDGFLRNKRIQAEVHDENCWKMGGVGPHAGLFGRLEDVLLWLHDFNQKLRPQFNYKSKSKSTPLASFSKKTTQAFLQKQRGDWRLGMMVPSRPQSSCGSYFSDSSYGHLGFTGVSFWVDPKVDLSVVILSNRTFPDRENKSFNIFRPLIHNIVWETLA